MPAARVKKQKFKIRYGIFALLCVVLISAAAVFSYVWSLLGRPAQTVIPIVTGGAVSEGILDSLPDAEDWEDQIDSSADASSQDTSASSASQGGSPNGTNNGGTGAVPWGNGRVRVYVDPRFPIIKVDQKDPNVENILLIGVDARSASQIQSRTDSIIVVTVDKNNRCIKMTSFMRDSQVKIPGRTLLAKINAAYVYGGIGLLINTMNQNFGLDIQKFAMVDMVNSGNIIDAVGGVTITLTRDEYKLVTGKTLDSGSISMLLTGKQAVAYGRIRKIGTDSARTQRQRNVLTALIASFKSAPLSKKMKMFESVFDSFETNISRSNMFFLSFDMLAGMRNIKQYRVPQDGLYTTDLSNYNLVISFAKQNALLHDFIWGNGSGTAISLPEQESEPPSPTPTSAASSATSSGSSSTDSASAVSSDASSSGEDSSESVSE